MSAHFLPASKHARPEVKPFKPAPQRVKSRRQGPAARELRNPKTLKASSQDVGFALQAHHGPPDRWMPLRCPMVWNQNPAGTAESEIVAPRRDGQ